MSAVCPWSYKATKLGQHVDSCVWEVWVPANTCFWSAVPICLYIYIHIHAHIWYINKHIYYIYLYIYIFIYVYIFVLTHITVLHIYLHSIWAHMQIHWYLHVRHYVEEASTHAHPNPLSTEWRLWRRMMQLRFELDEDCGWWPPQCPPASTVGAELGDRQCRGLLLGCSPCEDAAANLETKP